MKKTIYISLISFLFIGLISCEKIDPLSEQGSLTGADVPNAVLSTIAASAVNDTVTLSTTCWSVDDNIAKVEYKHKGYVGKTLSIKLKVEIDADNIYEYSKNVNTDSTFVDETLIASFTDLDTCYQTLMNAYVVKHDFIIPADYAIASEEGNSVITAMESENFANFAEQFSESFNKDVTKKVFGDAITAHDTTLFVFEKTISETTGSDTIIYSGALLDEGKTFVKENLTKDMVKTYLDKATSTEFAEVTIISTTYLTTGSFSVAEKDFEIIEAE